MKPLVSIILPVYNVEPYFEQCMDSVCNQTLCDIEIILVDDGSPDNCPQMCDDYAAKDNRIRVHHQENAGVSAARNVGIEMAQGNWIMFVDPDDWLELDAVEVLYRKAVETESDVAFASFVQNYSDKEKDSGTGSSDIEYVYDAQTYRNYLLGACFVTPFRTLRLFPEEMRYCTQIGTPWMKLYHTDFIRRNDLRFPTGLSLGEDRIFNLHAFYRSQRVCFINKRIYHYRMRENSAVGELQNNRHERILPQYEYFQELMRKYDLTAELKEYQHLSIAADMIKLMQSYYQNADSLGRFFSCARQLKRLMKHDLVWETVRELRIDDIQKYKPMFRLLRWRLYRTTLLVYRVFYVRYPDKYGKKKYT